MEKNVKISVLNEFYGKLLTNKQYEIIEDYYNRDLSLSEIAENNKITRQAVRDILKKGEKKLFEYEGKLHLMKKAERKEKQIQKVIEELDKISNMNFDQEKIEKIKNIRKELQNLEV